MAILVRPNARGNRVPLDTPPANPKIAFLLRERNNYFTNENEYSYGYFLNSGLLNSATLVMEMLRDRLHYDAALATLPDMNHIDRYVAQNNPDIVVLEAYWVTPAKLRELAPLHPDVLWVVRNHSSIPFLSLEGVVLDWSLDYIDIPNVVLSNNDVRTNHHIAQIIASVHPEWTDGEINSNCVLLPNYYPPELRREVDPPFADRVIKIGCFGAIRPLKNHLNQAVAAVEYCNRRTDLGLEFHINGSRLEQGGSPILNNIRALFSHLDPSRFQLVEHDWLDREEFLALVETMDVGMQVSFAETYNITAADFVTASKPIVVSPEITWVHPDFYANPTDTFDIRRVLARAIRYRGELARHHVNLRRLRLYSLWSAGLWKAFLHSPAVVGEEWNPTPGRGDLYMIKAMPDYIQVADPTPDEEYEPQ